MSSPTKCVIKTKGFVRGVCNFIFTFERKGLKQIHTIADVEVELQIATGKTWEGYQYKTEIAQLSDLIAQIQLESEWQINEASK